MSRVNAASETPPEDTGTALSIRGLRKSFGSKAAVDGIDLDVPSGSFYGLVGPNGAGKTTTLSMATGLLRPDDGQVFIHGVDVWREPIKAKRWSACCPTACGCSTVSRARSWSSTRDCSAEWTARRRPQRTADLLALLDLEKDGGTLVVDYSAGMTKKIALACAMVHAPRLLVLDEPFESVDPVSAANIRDILSGFVRGGGTVIVSSHVMDLVQRMCDHVAVITAGRVVVAGTVDDVRGTSTLEDRFVELVGGRRVGEGPEWLQHS